MYNYFTLSNGLQVIHRRTPGAAAGYFGVTVRAGSRDEQEGSFGLAHFVEHTLFKGTGRRSAWHILNRMEAVGGELNAFTSKEETTVYTAFPAARLDRAVELVADLLLNSRFPAPELQREREVVADEIASSLDQPAEAVFDDFDDLLFAGSSLGHNILGTTADLERFGSEECRSWLERWYTADNMVAFYSGPAGADRVHTCLERHLSALPAGANPHDMPQLCINPPFDTSRSVGSHQSHTVIGCRIGGLYSPDRFAMSLLANILGGPGMNSLLNVQLRERRGLVYTVEASTALYTDCGVMSIYYGCDHHDEQRCRRLVQQQLEAVAAGETINERKMRMAKKQYLGQMLLSGENRENSILGAARATLFHGRAADRNEMRNHIDEISLDSLCRCAEILCRNSKLTLC